jgi:DNA-binding XRE family transcriptional regulator
MAKDADVSRQTIQQAKAAHAAGLGEQVRDGKHSKRAMEPGSIATNHEMAEAADVSVKTLNAFALQRQETTISILVNFYSKVNESISSDNTIKTET